MKVDAYNFFFHPLHKDHADGVKGLSVLTNIVLTVITSGWYLLIFGAIHVREWVMSPPKKPEDDKAKQTFDKVFPPSPTTAPSKNAFVGLFELKRVQKEHLEKLEAYARKGDWAPLQKHTVNPDSGFDWWMFPISRPSEGQGNKYCVNTRYIQALQNDSEFMKNYRRGVILVAQSWGWDLVNNVEIHRRDLAWSGYQVRLGKMLRSLVEFGQKDLHDSLLGFVRDYQLERGLEAWILPYLTPIPASAAFKV